MARQRSPLAAFAFVLAAVAISGSVSPATPAVDASASASTCDVVTIAPAARAARRGGRVLLNGQACGSRFSGSDESVEIRIRKGKRWRSLAAVEAAADGSFSVCVRVRTPRRAKRARIRAMSSTGARGKTAVRISKRGSRRCESSPAPGSGDGGEPDPPQPLPPDPGDPSVLRQDTAASPDPMPLWNAIDAESPARHRHFTSGGPGGGPFRRMSVQDGDDSWGERAELGYNSRMNGLGAPWGTFYLYGQNQRRITEFSLRLPTSFPINTSTWQVVMQMKQTGPSSNSGGTPVLALEAREGSWVLTQSDSPGPSGTTHELWSTPATLGTWTPISLDVTYSPDPARGKVQITVGGVESPTFTTFTQKYETAPAGPGLSPGSGIPSHLRMGIYHNPSLPGTHVDIAGVRVRR